MDRTGTAVRSLTATDRRTIGDVGRRARLELRFALRRGRTVIEHAYAEPPFRVSRSFDHDGELHLIMTMTAPGIFGGDDFRQAIVVGPGARVRLTSQSAQQIHPSPDGQVARTVSSYDVGESATLVCCWDAVIPFSRARLENRVSIAVADGARLVWGDAMMGGREARGERWKFSSVDHELALRRGERLAYLERYRLEAAVGPLRARWMAGASSHLGTTLAVAPGIDAATAEKLHHELQGRPGLSAAVDQLEPGLLMARFTAESGAAFHRARTECHSSLLSVVESHSR